MERWLTRDVFLRLTIVIKFLVIDCATASDGRQQMSRDTFVVASPTGTDIDQLLKELKSELARDTDPSYAYCYAEENCTGGQYCDVQTHQCMCDERSYPEDGVCPTVGNRCDSCCCGQNVYCFRDICQLYEVDTVSSQMILSIVMVMGLVSIIFMVYRMCYRTKLQQRLIHTVPIRDSQRPSLSSLQVGVMSRMRDRPPTYETRHNYQQRRTAEEEEHETRSSGVDNPALEVCEVIAPPPPPREIVSPILYINTPPPPYTMTTSQESDDTRSIASPRTSVLRAEPPPYSVAIKEQQRDSLGNSKELYI